MISNNIPDYMDSATIGRIISPNAGKRIEEDLEYSGDEPLSYLGRRNMEKAMLSMVCSGNLLLLEDYLNQNRKHSGHIPLGILSKETLTQYRYLCVVIVTLVCRAAIDAGVPEPIAFSLSDSFIQKVDTIYHPEEFMDFGPEVMRTYCQTVHDTHMKNSSAPVRKCCEYMMLKLHSNITLQELSHACHLSPNYISDLFRKELGIGALQYFHRIKLQYARHLVLYSDWSIAKISAHLSYPSQSNFTERFKKTYGTTPMQYRQNSSYSQI